MSSTSVARRLLVVLILAAFAGCGRKPAVPSSASGSPPVEKVAEAEPKTSAKTETGPASPKAAPAAAKQYPLPEYHDTSFIVTSGPGGEDHVQVNIRNRGAAGEFLVMLTQGARAWKLICHYESGEERVVDLLSPPGFDPLQERRWVVKAVERADPSELQGAQPEKEHRAARRVRQISPVRGDGRLVKEALYGIRELPEVFWEGHTDDDLARELDLRVWAFDYQGGPLTCRVDVEETGQETVDRGSLFREANYQGRAEASEGRVCLWMRRALSERMRQIGLRAGKEGSTKTVAWGFIAPGFGAVTGRDFPFLWFHWNGGSLKEEANEETPAGNEAVTILTVEATETRPVQQAKPRQVKLTLKARFLKAEEVKPKGS